MIRFRLTFPALLLAATPAIQPLAAQSYDNCTGYIDSVPATIAKQGTWCLRKDLSTALKDGAAIQVAANNVTIDCNHFKLGGSAAGLDTIASGIRGDGVVNMTVRNCNVRGFAYGVDIQGWETTRGNVVEDNRLDGNTLVGILVSGEGSVVRRNLVLNTGSSMFLSGLAYGISAAWGTDVIDNTVHGVAPRNYGDVTSAGILIRNNHGAVVEGNRIRGLFSGGENGAALGIIDENSSMLILRDNEIIGDGRARSRGFKCTGTTGRATGNVVLNFPVLVEGSCAEAGNVFEASL